MHRKLSYSRTKSPFRGGASRRRSVSRRRTGGSPHRRRSVNRGGYSPRRRSVTRGGYSPRRYYGGIKEAETPTPKQSPKRERKTRAQLEAEANALYNGVTNAGIKEIANTIKTFENLTMAERNALMAALRVANVTRGPRRQTEPDEREFYVLGPEQKRCKSGFKKVTPARDYANQENKVLRSECLRRDAWIWPEVTRRAARTASGTPRTSSTSPGPESPLENR
jgi:hypothetical protein